MEQIETEVLNSKDHVMHELRIFQDYLNRVKEKERHCVSIKMELEQIALELRIEDRIELLKMQLQQVEMGD
jgi:hypothetical protein